MIESVVGVKSGKFDQQPCLSLLISQRTCTSSIFRYAFVFFASEAAAKESHDKMQNKTLDGRTLVVLFGKKTPHQAGGGKRKETTTSM